MDSTADTAVMSSNVLMVKDCKFIWKISNFSIRCKEVGDVILSPIFTAGEDVVSNKIQWRLKLYPFGDDDDNRNFISLFLICALSDDIDKCDVSFSFDLWNNHEIKKRKEPPNTFHNHHSTDWGYSKFLSRNKEEFKRHLSSGNDTLSIMCCMYDITPYYKNRFIYSVELIRGFNSLFLSENFSDVTIEIDNKKLKAHKNILSARSEVFSAMFKHNTVESNESVIKITDISYNVMKEVLRFFYCGEVENLDLHKKDLLIAADKYDLDLLKECCEDALCRSLSVSNVCEILKFADLHNCYKLKTESLNFLIKNIKEVVDRPELIQLAHTNPNLSLDIFRSIGNK